MSLCSYEQVVILNSSFTWTSLFVKTFFQHANSVTENKWLTSPNIQEIGSNTVDFKEDFKENFNKSKYPGSRLK